MKDLPYSPDELDVLMTIMQIRNGIVVLGDSPYQTLDDLIEAAKAEPGKLTYSSPGGASVQSFLSTMLNKAAGIQTTHVPFDGGGPAVAAVLGGHVDYGVIGLPPATSQLASGSLRLLTIFSDNREPSLPDVPTAQEAGYDVSVPHSEYVVVPAGIPEARKQVLIDAFVKVAQSEVFLKLANKLKLEVQYVPAEETMQAISRSDKIFADIIAAQEK